MMIGKKQQSHRNQAWEMGVKNKSKENRKRWKRVGRATTDFFQAQSLSNFLAKSWPTLVMLVP
jgi:hypothetical protein